MLMPMIIQMFLDIIVGWAAASSSWRGNIVQLPYAVARLNIAGYIDEHNYYFGTNSGKHKSYGGNGSSNSSNNSSSSNGTNHNAINGRIAKRLLYQKYSYNRRLNKELQHQHQHQHHHQPQSQQRIKKMSYHNNNRWQKESDRYSLHTKSKINADSSKNCGRFTSVFASVECLLRFVSLYFTRSPSQQSVKYPSKENFVSESKKKIGRVRRKRQGLAAWSNFTIPPTQSPTPG